MQNLINKPHKLYALVDANNFYASCEKVFRPDLIDTPLVVLSNNDGCIVARSKEAKALGIGMAEPYFKVKTLLEKHNVSVFSSNYALYGDMSQRIISILEDFCPEVEQYSIDEAFINLDTPLIANAKELIFSIRERISKWIGIQVSIGLAQTRTLAKLANYLAKKSNGVYYLDVNDPKFSSYLENVPVGEVWGIGRRSAKKLENVGIRTALQLKNTDDQRIRRILSVTGWNTVLELRGIPACEITALSPDENKPRKSLVCSRSFAKRITNIKDLDEAVSFFATSAGERLRNENLLAGGIQVSMRTSKHIETEFYSPAIQYSFAEPCADSRIFIEAAQSGLKQIYKDGFAYAKAGVMLFDIVKSNNFQPSLLSYTPENQLNRAKSDSLMCTLDKINHKFGNKSIFFGAVGAKNASWHMKQERKSPAFTSSWNELPKAKC